MNTSKALLQRFLPLIGAALLIAAAFAPHKEKKHRLRIVPGVWPAAEAVLLAGDMQILPPNRFQVIEIPWSSAIVRAFGSGAADVAVVTLDSALRMRDSGQKLRVLMVLNQSTGADALLGRSGIQRIEDLKGKRVGLERSAGSYLLVNALESVGMTMKDIEAVPMFQSEMENALQTDQVDAIVATEPWLMRLSHNDMHRLYDSNQLKIPILYLMVASERSCATSREELVTLLRIQAETAARLWTGKSFPGMDGVLRREKMNADELGTCFHDLHSLSKTENADLLKKLPQMAAQMEEQMLRNGIITNKLPDTEWINTSFSEEAFR